MSNVISGGLLGHLGPRPKPLDGSILLKFLLETRLNLSLFILWMTCCVSGSKVMI